MLSMNTASISSRRRTRWTVTFDDGYKWVCLAYDRPDVERTIAHFHGHRPVAAVDAGDHRKEPQRDHGARPLMSAVREAADLLGLTLPVEVRTNSRQGTKRGCYSPRSKNPRVAYAPGGAVYRAGSSATPASEGCWAHTIMVKSYLPAERMGRVLWHELTHALQFERDVLGVLGPDATVLDAHMRMRTLYRDGTSYSVKPWEVEAREHEPLNDDLPLAR